MYAYWIFHQTFGSDGIKSYSVHLQRIIEQNNVYMVD